VDKAEFIEKAPQYYALAIAVGLIAGNNKSAKTLVGIDNAIDTSYRCFQKRSILDHGLKILADADVIEVIPDDFGPAIYKPKESLSQWIVETNLSAFQKYTQIRSMAWVRDAVRSVNETADRLAVEDTDFEPAILDQQWEPIPLDRNDEKLKEVTKALDDAISSIEADNGYAANVPAEREYVLTNLKDFRKAVKEKTELYWPQIKANALAPLGRVIKRFGPAAVGVAAVAARTAIIEWVKANWPKFLDWF
jgi:hypothetical protein